jgi:hypothetical protein
MRVGHRGNSMNPCRLIITAILLLLASTAGAKTLIVPPRPGQVGLSVQGQYGTLLESGALGEDFGTGPGMAVRLRYRMRYERALGLSFESQSYDTRSNAKFVDSFTGQPIPSDTTFAPAKATLTTAGVDFYKMFGTRSSTTRMLSASAGLAQVHLTLNDKETEFRPDGLYLGAGAGIEKFFWGSWAWDLSARYMALFEDGSTKHLFQASLGLVVYASY